jgi:hypothetical protein
MIDEPITQQRRIATTRGARMARVSFILME